MLSCNFSVVFHIHLSGYQYHVGFNVADLPDLIDPGLNVSVARWVCYRVGKNDSMSAFVERFGNVSEPLLACGVPNVESDLAAIDLNSFDFEVYADCAQIVSLEGILAVSNQQARLSHSTVSYYQILQSYILLRAHYLFKLLLKFDLFAKSNH